MPPTTDKKEFKVKFETGQTVKFDRQPSQADIEEVANNLGINATKQPSKQPEQPKSDGFFKGLAKDIIRPVATLAARPVQLAKAIGGATPEEQAVNVPGLGRIETSRSGKDVVKDVGRGIETVALGVGGAGAKTAAKQAIGGATKETAKQTVKRTGLDTARAGLGRLGNIQGSTAFRTGVKSGTAAGGLSAIGADVAEKGTADIGTAVEGVFGAGLGGVTGGVLGKATGTLANVAKKQLGKVQKPLPGIPGKLQQEGKKDIVQTLQEKVMPQLTAKEKRLAKAQGRVIRGSQSKLFGDKADTVLPDKATKKALETLQRRIKGVEKLDDVAISNTATREIESIAKKLKPKLQEVRLTAKTAEDIRDRWADLMVDQSKQVDFVSASGSRMQKQFQEVMDSLTRVTKDSKTGKLRASSLDDVWELAKKYDEIIPDRIKQANDLSDGALQAQKEMWLENRDILRELLKKTAGELKGEQKRAFSDMTDLYKIRNNINSRTDIVTKDKPGILRPRNILGATAATGVGVPILGALGSNNQ